MILSFLAMAFSASEKPSNSPLPDLPKLQGPLKVKSPVLPVAPPPAPSIRGGDISCKMYDDEGKQFGLSGKLGDWYVNKYGRNSAKFLMESPDNINLSGLYNASIEPLTITINKYDSESKFSVRGFVQAGYAPDGMIMIEYRPYSTAAKKQRFVGFCDTQLSEVFVDLGIGK